ncbi:hypothetical protein [Streptomyces sp. NPDC091209]|uniref:LppU/SCO3897 family protein n=1 Tax=Streptomyces sp. NPDC091209 TaxID=3365974 RepID=UPI0038232E6E
MEATVRGHQGFLVIMRFLKLQGPFCRRCGIAAHREMTAKSLWQGWWGIASSVINPITMLINIPQRMKINRLAEPIPGAPGRPMDPGRPVFLRLAILGPLVPVLIIGLLAVADEGDPEFAHIGQCVHVSGSSSDPDVSVVGCGDADADYKIIGRLTGSTSYKKCERYPGFEAAYTEEDDSTKYTLCLGSNRAG